MSVNIKVNRLPALTWNHLGMNDATVYGIGPGEEGVCRKEIPRGILFESAVKDAGMPFVAAGMGEELEELLQSPAISAWRVSAPEGQKMTQPVRFHFSCREGKQSFNRIEIHAERNSELTVVMDFLSADDSDGNSRSIQTLYGIQTKVYAQENSLVRLVQVQNTDENLTFLNDIGARCETDAGVEVIQLMLGGKDTYLGCRAALEGERSSFLADIGYLAQGRQRLDMNYEAIHRGRQSSSKINASGVLRDRAEKLFRGTIDFQTGAAGASGNEKEDVLLLDDGVVNRTIPLILCAEEDVEGNHGATIGKLDEDLLFYLESRGIAQKDIYEMLAKARLDAMCKKIPDEETRLLAQNMMAGDLFVETAASLEGESDDEHK